MTALFIFRQTSPATAVSPPPKAKEQWEQAIELQLTTGQTVSAVFHWIDKGTIKAIYPKVLIVAGRRRVNGQECRGRWP